MASITAGGATLFIFPPTCMAKVTYSYLVPSQVAVSLSKAPSSAKSRRHLDIFKAGLQPTIYYLSSQVKENPLIIHFVNCSVLSVATVPTDCAIRLIQHYCTNILFSNHSLLCYFTHQTTSPTPDAASCPIQTCHDLTLLWSLRNNWYRKYCYLTNQMPHYGVCLYHPSQARQG